MGEDRVRSLSCRQVRVATEDGPEAEMGRGWNPGIRNRPLPWGPQGPLDSVHFLDMGLRERAVSRMISVTGMGQVELMEGEIQEVTGYLARCRGEGSHCVPKACLGLLDHASRVSVLGIFPSLVLHGSKPAGSSCIGAFAGVLSSISAPSCPFHEHSLPGGRFSSVSALPRT